MKKKKLGRRLQRRESQGKEVLRGGKALATRARTSPVRRRKAL